MKTIKQYVDDLKEIYGSDYATAKELGIRKECVSIIRKNSRVSDETAVKMAKALGINADEILIAAAIERSKGDVKSAWENVSKKAGIKSNVFLLAGSVAPALINTIAAQIEGVKCILCKIAKRSFQAMVDISPWPGNERFLPSKKKSRTRPKKSSGIILCN